MRGLGRLAVVGLTLAAISQEMNKPPAERTWTGKVFNLIPYDFRPPTWDRLRAAYWNPDDPRIFTERPLGVGWAINFFRAQLLIRGLFGNLMGEEPQLAQPRRSARKASARP
jgi:hypothetical protein